VAVVAVALGAAVVTGLGDGADGSGSSAREEVASEPAEELVEVTSDAPRYPSLDELVAAADLVVRGEVASTERGRTFGQPGGSTIVSRLATLRIDEVLAGTAPRADTVLVEEEGWLDDGRALVVDGAGPTRVGDAGFWFLVEVDDPDLPVYTTVGAAGRYLVTADDGRLQGADDDDPLVAEIEAVGADDLAATLRRAG
jgi:hypothetical protein